MPYSPYLIGNERAGYDLHLDPWLLPPDAYPQLENFYLYQGRLYNRNGYALFGKMVHKATAESLGTGNAVLKTFSGTLTNKPVRPGDLSITDTAETFTDPTGSGVLTGSVGGTGTIVYATGVYSVTFHAAPGSDIAITATYNWYPGLPVMGIFNYTTSAGSQQLCAFNTRRMNIWNDTLSIWEDVSGADIWTGDNTNFFWMENWQNQGFICNGKDQLYIYNGSTLTAMVIDTVNSQVFIGGVSLGTGTGSQKTFGGTLANPLVVAGTFTCTDGVETFIDNGNGTLSGNLGGSGTLAYSTGIFSVTFHTAPILSAVISANFYYNTTSGANHVAGCVFIAQWKNRLILFKPTEDGSDKNQRIRWCAIGDPTTWAWNNYLDADGSSVLAAGAWISDTIIGFFDRGVSKLMYLGETQLPFFWQVIAANEGALAAMSPLELEDEAMFLSVTRIAGTDGYQVYYLDQKIPTLITSMNQSLIKFAYSGYYEPFEQAWLSYPSLAATAGNDKVAIFNTDDNSWAIFDIPLTCYGYYERGGNLIWSECTFPWSSTTIKWNDRNLQGGYPILLGGDQNGNVWQVDSGSTDGNNATSATATALTAQLNPFVKQGLQARLGWLDMLVDSNPNVTLTVNLYSDGSLTPYSSFQVPLSDGRGLPKSWIRLPSGVAGNFHQIGFINDSGIAGGVVLHALVPYFAEGGPITY